VDFVSRLGLANGVVRHARRDGASKSAAIEGCLNCRTFPAAGKSSWFFLVLLHISNQGNYFLHLCFTFRLMSDKTSA
jgi:hypothetical protein